MVIPALNEAERLPRLLGDLANLDLSHEVIVVDGGSGDTTVTVAADAGATVRHAPRGRAVQLNAGAAVARGEWLAFLHADVRLPAPARADLCATVPRADVEAAVWRLHIDADGAWYRVIEFGAHLRDRLGGLPYGDQGLLVRRSLFARVGGYPEIPLMEDVALVRALRRRTRLVRFPSSLLVSARRWRREGPVRTWVRNAALVTAYLAGVPAERLARWYRSEPTPS